jgi:gamma-glutamyltranspeptidase/glutathione hydrolase
MPTLGWLPVTVPGAPALWRDLHARFGRLPFAQLFEPAIYYAAHGFPLGPETAGAWAAGVHSYAQNTGPEFRGWLPTFAPDGTEPRPGDLRASPDHAATLRRIADSNADDFYHGALATRIVRFAQETGGYLTADDLATHTSTWVDPISANYRGYDIWEIPPNGQGIAALEALNILEGFDLARQPRDSVEGYHLQIEAMKLAFADAFRFVADMDHEQVPVARLLDKEYAAQRRQLIGREALEPATAEPERGGTVYLCAADADGMMVSFIQSNYMGFGSGIVVPGTGIALQNRGACFVLDPAHPNCLAPGKRPFHTIIPAFLTRDGAPVGPFGVMGGHMQPQGHLQMVVNQVDYGMDPQTSLDAPRWRWLHGQQIEVEMTVPAHVVHGLMARGHQVTVRSTASGFGRGQIIRRLANGAYVAGSEPRADGCAAGW